MLAFNEFETLVVVDRLFSGTRKTRIPGKSFESFSLRHLVLVAKHENAHNLSRFFSSTRLGKMHETPAKLPKIRDSISFPQSVSSTPRVRSISINSRYWKRIQSYPRPPMKKIFFPAVILFVFTSCVTVRERGDTSLPTWRTFHAKFDRVWGALVSEISSFAVIKTIDKTNGLITTEPLKMGSGLMSEILLKLYAHRPSKFLGTWDDGRTVLSFLATSKALRRRCA